MMACRGVIRFCQWRVLGLEHVFDRSGIAQGGTSLAIEQMS